MLVLGFFLVLGIAYQYSFSRTIQIKEELEDLQEQISMNSHPLSSLASLEEKETKLDSIISRNILGSTSLQNNLLKVLNEFSEDISYKVISFKEPHVNILKNSTNSRITSYQFVLEGDYKNLERILYLLEKDYSFGSFSHINFERKKDYRLNRNYLQCSVVIQNAE